MLYAEGLGFCFFFIQDQVNACNGYSPLRYAMITTLEIDDIKILSQPFRPELEAQWNLLPATSCGRRAECCALLPQMSLVETGRALAALEDLGPEVLRETTIRLAEYFFLNPVRIMGCPFLVRKGCLIYSHRPFGCRAYGLWSASAYAKQAEKSRAAKKQVNRAWLSLGIKIPREVTGHRLPYCREVKPMDGKAVDDRLLEEVSREIGKLDLNLAAKSKYFTDRLFNDLSFLTVNQYLDENAALKNKVAVVREFLENGKSPSLAHIIEKIAAD